MLNKKRIYAGILCFLMLFILCACGNKKEEKPAVYTEEHYDDLVRNVTVTYNKTKIKAPFKLQDFIDAGLEWDSENRGEEIVAPDEINNGESFLKIPGDEKVLYYVAQNLEKKETPLKNCTVVLLVTDSEKITINEITPNKSSYEDVIALYGKDVENRKSTYDEEMPVCYEEGRTLLLEYWAFDKGENNKDSLFSEYIFQAHISVEKNTISHVSIQLRK